ncbi:hypothetical protein BPAE_0176g00080 [Botrytis paeoniae]|uniref:Uncharacterized protein n=1 Tax=Botrytis paeoniae TaxID=278948 RepID=A0A4Z1FI12_9HELO|nr:hypothetical protein BPAE_0176g00080 [Botrytis paeoniae]
MDKLEPMEGSIVEKIDPEARKPVNAVMERILLEKWTGRKVFPHVRLHQQIKRDEERKNETEEKWKEEEAKNKQEYDLGNGELDYRRRVEQDRNRPGDRPEVRPSGATDRGYHRGGDQKNARKKVCWEGQTFRGKPRG